MQNLTKLDLRDDSDNIFFKPHFSNDQSFQDVCKLFEIQANKNSNKIAISFESSVLTYIELHHKSDQIAFSLQRHGLEPGTIVGLYLENNLNLAIAILGILKAGGVYLPLDPNYPIERVKYMLEDAKPAILLTQKEISYKIPSYQTKILKIEKILEEPYKNQNLKTVINPNHLAYIIYTSGSTGAPKGIMVSHQSLAEAIQVRTNIYPKNPTGLLSTSISFDPSILIFFCTLILGGKLCIPNYDSIIDIQKMANLLEKESITFMLCVPSLYSMILDKGQKLSFLKHVSLVGESIPNSLLFLHKQLAPNAELYNEYGPSEYAIGTTIAKIYDPKQKVIHKITVGKPHKNAEVYILDENFQLLPLGSKGEIYIGGVGLAVGYLNKEALTKEKFLWITLNNQPPMRLYRSGDFGRFLPNGDIEFLGRLDQQVKIRGYRIELGEIEQTICQFEGVEECAIIVQEDPKFRKHLIGYFSSFADKSFEKELKAFLKTKLPTPMIPSKLIQVKQFSRTPNGKIDRKVLHQIKTSVEMNHQYVPQKSSLQENLLKIWKQILNRENIGIHDNFFETGGDSLQITSFQTQIKSLLKMEVPISDFFQFPTIFKFTNKLNNRTNPYLISQLSSLTKKRPVFQQFKPSFKTKRC